MRIIEVSPGRAAVIIDRSAGVSRHMFIVCAGPRDEVTDAPAGWAGGASTGCGTTVLVEGLADEELYAALGRLGWDRTGELLRCPVHA